MEQTTFSLRMDKGLKIEFDALCKALGMNTSVAINMFARQMVREQKLPFTPSLDSDDKTSKYLDLLEKQRISATNNGTADMSLDEINSEIDKTRKIKK